jgi:hypothetical protein
MERVDNFKRIGWTTSTGIRTQLRGEENVDPIKDAKQTGE